MRLTGNPVAYVLGLLLAGGCAAGHTEPAPLSSPKDRLESALAPDQVQVFQSGEGTPEACMRLIPVSVGGNPFAQPEELQEAIRDKAAEMGANRVFLDPRPAERPFVTAGREGGRLLKRESDPQLSGLVCRALPVHLGFQVDSGWRVEYVFPASQAEAAGLKVGDQIMILNDRHNPSDPAAWDRVFAKGKVGDRMDIVFLDRKGDLQRRFLELLPVECIRAGIPAGAC